MECRVEIKCSRKSHTSDCVMESLKWQIFTRHKYLKSVVFTSLYLVNTLRRKENEGNLFSSMNTIRPQIYIYKFSHNLKYISCQIFLKNKNKILSALIYFFSCILYLRVQPSILLASILENWQLP